MTRPSRLLGTAVLCLPLLLAVGQTTSAHAATATADHVTAVPRAIVGRTMIINTAATSSGMAAAQTAAAQAGARVSAAWPQIGVTVAVVADARIDAAVAQVRRAPGIVSAGSTGEVRTQPAPVPRKRVTATPPAEDSRIADAAHVAGLSVTGKGVTIGVADDGIFDEHSDVAQRFDQSRSGSCTQAGAFLGGKDEWRPRSMKDKHGTAVSSVAAGTAHNGGIRGVAPEASVVVIRVVSPDGNIYPEASICATMRAAALGLPVLNHSYGLDHVVATRHALWDPQDRNHKAAIDAVNKAFAWSRTKNVLNIAATGNSGDDLAEKSRIPLPESDRSQGPLPDRLVALLAQVPTVVGVGESDVDGTVMPSSTSGLGLVDISAVGNGTMAATPGEWIWDAGTSFASPAVAGAAALVKQAHPAADAAQIESALLGSARPRGCAEAGLLLSDQPCRSKGPLTSYFGRGLLDAAAAVKRGQ